MYFYFRKVGLQEWSVQAEQHHKHWDMDGAHHHVCLVEGGQDLGVCPTNREIPITFCDQSYCDSENFMAGFIQCVNISKQLLPLLI